MSDPLAWMDDEASAWAQRGLARRVRVRDAGSVNYGGNDYLGLGADPRLIMAAGAAAERFGWGAGASPLVAGWTDAHRDLADALVHFERCEAVTLFASG